MAIRTCALLVGLYALVAACGSDKGGDGVDASVVDADPNAPDADPNAPDADPNAPDAGEVQGVVCGETTCEIGQDCCVGVGGGGSQTCVEADTCQGTTISCDGTGQCTAEGEVCCGTASDGGGTECVEADSCQVPICQEAEDCPDQGHQCCMVGNIGFCRNSCTPGG
jgi:hypothetical protein